MEKEREESSSGETPDSLLELLAEFEAALGQVPGRGADGAPAGEPVVAVRRLREHLAWCAEARREAERAAAEAEERTAHLEALFQALPNPVSLYDIEGRIVRTNRAAKALVRHDPADLEKPLAERLGLARYTWADGRTIPLEELPGYRALQGEGVSGDMVRVVQERDGEEVTTWLEVAAVPVYGPAGEQMGAAVASIDVTERKKMELALRQARDEFEQRVVERTAELEAEIAVRRETEASLRESEMRFRQMAEHIGETFYLFEPEPRRLIYVSPGYETVWGRPAEELYRRPSAFFDGIHPEDRDRVWAEMETGWLTWDVEFRVVRPDGSLRWVRGRAFPVVSEPGAAPRMAGILEDVTLQKEAHEARVRAERLQTAGMLAASLSHEINNPLQAALGALDLGREALADGRPVAPYLEVGHNALRRAAGVMAQMRGLFASEAAETTGTVYLDELVRQAVSTTMVHWEARGVAVVFEPCPDVPCVRTMPTPLQQVFLNLLLNAVEATPEGGQVHVGAGYEPERNRVWVRFADTGPGMPPEVLAHLFEPFQTTKAGGLGLGLFISRNLVEKAGGGIEVESEPGRGTTMSVWLPV